MTTGQHAAWIVYGSLIGVLLTLGSGLILGSSGASSGVLAKPGWSASRQVEFWRLLAVLGSGIAGLILINRLVGFRTPWF